MIVLPKLGKVATPYAKTVADPGFPVGGGADPLGGANLRCIHFLVKTYAKTKEIDPVGGGGGRRRRPLDLPMKEANRLSWPKGEEMKRSSSSAPTVKACPRT